MTPRTLDKYELLEKVGEGGMAEVYRGRHLTLGREVAVKILHPHLSATERNRLRFEREARAIESLEHEYILRIFDYSGRDSSICYIVTEFIRGRTLREVLNQRPTMPSEVAALIGTRLCSALQYAHDHGIIHRDIKPENVMIRDDGTVKLMDFGIARVLDESSMTLTGGLVGSPAYMSPEQAGDRDADLRSDIFSLGTLLYRSVTGHLPFSGTSTAVILRNILEGNFPDPADLEPGIAPELADIVRKAMSLSPEHRYSSAAEMGGVLSELLCNSEISNTTGEIQRYLADAEAYETWLHTHLAVKLAARGRWLITQGDSAGALKLLNRLLTLDESNQEVRSVIRDLHGSDWSNRRKVLAAAMVLLLPLGMVFALSWMGLDPRFGPAPDRAGVPVGASGDASGMPLAGKVLPKVPEGSLEGPETTSGGTAVVKAPGSATATPGVLPTDTLVKLVPGVVRASNGETPVAGNPEPGTPPGRTAGLVGTPAPRVPSDRQGSALHPSAGIGRPGQEKDRASAVRKDPVKDRTGPDGAALRPGLVHIQSMPFSEIYLNGKSYGGTVQRTEPITLPPGLYDLRLVNPLCEPLVDRVELSEGQIFERFYNLTPLPGRLFLKNFDAGSEVILDGQKLGEVGALTFPISISDARVDHHLEVRTGDNPDREFVIPPMGPGKEWVVDGTAPP